MKNAPIKNVILVDVRSSHNVGSIFRTSDALGINKIYLAGYTPAPKDKFGRVNQEITKVALGAENSVPWEPVKDVAALIDMLKGEKIKIIAVEQDERAEDYKNLKLTGSKGEPDSVAFVFGNEVDGLSEEVLSACDKIIEIPMRGKKESLNVAVSFGIALARVLNL